MVLIHTLIHTYTQSNTHMLLIHTPDTHTHAPDTHTHITHTCSWYTHTHKLLILKYAPDTHIHTHTHAPDTHINNAPDHTCS